MGLESGTYVSDLNVANPLGSDAKSDGDAHLRLIKTVLKNTFPNLTGAVDATQGELNEATYVNDTVTVTCIAGVSFTGIVRKLNSKCWLMHGFFLNSTGSPIAAAGGVKIASFPGTLAGGGVDHTGYPIQVQGFDHQSASLGLFQNGADVDIKPYIFAGGTTTNWANLGVLLVNTIFIMA